MTVEPVQVHTVRQDSVTTIKQIDAVEPEGGEVLKTTSDYESCMYTS